MWSSRRAVSIPRRRLLGGLLLALPAGLGGCGFRPLYAGPSGEHVATELAAIEVVAPKSRLGRILQNQLIDDLNPAGLAMAKRYRLDVRLRRDRRALAIQLDDTITRFDLTLAAFFTLREGAGGGGRISDEARLEAIEDDDADDQAYDVVEGDEGDQADLSPTLYRSAVRRVATYNVIREPFATLIAEQDAERRAAVEVSRQIRTLLTIFFESFAA
jgi:LPS-assembly lipoprotein